MFKGCKMYHYFYKITNLSNGKYYYGIHSTNNLNDGYMGSGTYLHSAFKKYGLENFKKDIIQFFNTREELANYEKKIVTEDVILDKNCYNIALGGEKTKTIDSVSVVDSEGNHFRCAINDERYLNGEYVPVTKQMVPVYDSFDGKNKNVTVTEYNLDRTRYRLFGYYGLNMVSVKLKGTDGPYFLINVADYDKNIYDRATSGKLLYKDSIGNAYYLKTNDALIKEKQLIPFTTGRRHSDETIKKMKTTFSKTKHQQGEKNSNYGKCWIYKCIDGEYYSKTIIKENLNFYLHEGWKLGRKIIKTAECDNKKRVWINNGNTNKRVLERYSDRYLNEGWHIGKCNIKQ